MPNNISQNYLIHPITEKLLNNSISLSDLLKNPQIFYENRTIYDSRLKAKCKGYEAEHLISVSLQIKKYNQEHNTHYIDRNIFEKEIGIPDDRCYRLTSFEHIISHLIKAYFNEEEHLIFSKMTKLNLKKLDENEKEILNKCKEYSELRKLGFQKIGIINSQRRIGKHHSEETKRKISEANKNRIVSEETRQKISKIHKGKIIPEWHKEILRTSNSNRKVSEETRQKMALAAKGNKNTLGKKWYNNGEKEILIFNNPPEGFKLGRLPK